MPSCTKRSKGIVLRALTTRKSRQRWLVVALYSAVVATLSLMPIPSTAPSPFSHSDKLIHLGMYALLMLLLLRAAAATSRLPRIECIALFAAGAGYGVLMEIGQHLLKASHRSFSIADITFNTAGALLTMLLFQMSGGAIASGTTTPSRANMEKE